MAGLKSQHFLFYLVSLSFIVFGDAARVHIYSEPDFKGSNHERNSSNNCTNLWSGLVEISLKTTECIVVFRGKDCDQVPNKYSSSVQSFRDCRNMDGRREADLDFSGRFGVTEPTTHFQFRDVCGCKNLPARTLDSFRTNTFGKCFNFYKDPDCSGEWIPSFPIYMSNLYVDPASSFQPCDIPSHCFRFEAFIYKLEPIGNLSNLMETVRRISMTATSRQSIINNGRGTAEQIYKASKEITESAQFEFSNAMKNFSSISFDGSVQVGSEVSLPLVGDLMSKLKASAGMGYQHESGSNKGYRFEYKNKTVFTLEKKIFVPPCTIYNVSSYVQISEDVAIDLRVQAQITGKTITNQKLSSKEVLKHLKGKNLTFLSNSGDNFSVFVETTAQIKVQRVGLQSVFNMIDEQIPDCVERNKHLICEPEQNRRNFG